MAETTSISGWDWDTNHVNTTATATGGTFKPEDFVEAGTVLILAGPSKLAENDVAIKTTQLIPIGLVDQFSVSQQKNIQQIFEIGSKLNYVVPGRTVGQIQIARAFFDGASLMKALTAQRGGTENPSAANAAGGGLYSITDNFTKADVAQVGSGNFYANLASSFFDISHGICLMFRDQKKDNVAMLYFEDCLISAHNFGISAQQNIIQEACSITYSRIVPVAVAATALK